MINNANEKKYLIFAQIAAYLNPVERHTRTIYNVFNCCRPVKLQQEILKQANIENLNLEKYNKENFKKQLLDCFIKEALQNNIISETFVEDEIYRKSLLDWLTDVLCEPIRLFGKVKIAGHYGKDNGNNIDTLPYFDKNLYHKYDSGHYERIACTDIQHRIEDYLFLQSTYKALFEHI